MTIDYESHPADLVGSGEVDGKENKINIKHLRQAIPPHCFEASYLTTLRYVVQDITLAAALAYLAFNYIPLIGNDLLRYTAWGFYGWAEGLVFTGFWVLGHEFGHGTLGKSKAFCDFFGFFFHSMLMTPYFSWRSSHRRHHIYANNLSKDHNYVPPQREEYADSLLIRSSGFNVERLEELTEDSPIFTLARLLLQQIVGFPWYLLTNITAAPTSLPDGKERSWKFLGNSHFVVGHLFRPEEFGVIMASNAGLLALAAVLYYFGTQVGHATMCLMYLQPYMWVNHWVVAITYLHHTHPDLPKYEDEAWSFIKGATATVDREMGWIGRYLFHHVVEYHVIHHIFSKKFPFGKMLTSTGRIPFYHAEEATKAVIPLLGDAYHEDKDRAYIPCLYESFTKCQWVEPDKPEAAAKDRVMWYKGGPSPPPEVGMNAKGWASGLMDRGRVLGRKSQKVFSQMGVSKIDI